MITTQPYRSMKVLSIAFFLFMIVSFATDIYIPSLPQMIHVFSLNQYHIQAVLYVFLFSYGTGQLIFGILADHLGRRHSLITGLIIASIGSIITIFSHTFAELLIGRFTQEIGIASSLYGALQILGSFILLAFLTSLHLPPLLTPWITYLFLGIWTIFLMKRS